MTAVSPGTLANFFPNRHYPSREAYLEAMAEVMKREYDAIVQAGFLLQLDCPDLALRSTWFPDLSIPEFRTVVAQNIAALNTATRDIPPERVRMHVCWGPVRHHTTTTCRSETSSIYCSRGGRWPCLLWGQMGAMSMSGKYGRTCSSRLGRCSSPGSSTRRRTSSSIPKWWRSASCATPTCWGGERHRRGRLRLWHQCAD